jgi:hypothetical protein
MLTVAIIVLIFIGLPVVILVARDRMARARRDHPATRLRVIADRQPRETRLLAPDWTCVERHLQRPTPRALRELYADRTLVTQRDIRFSTDCTISSFEPLDEQALADAREWLGFTAVVFATTQEGDAIYLRSGPAEGGDVVYLTHHDGGDTEVLATTIDEMLDALRRLHS